jgi:thiol-disulfide isomerase/thioredoxin
VIHRFLNLVLSLPTLVPRHSGPVRLHTVLAAVIVSVVMVSCSNRTELDPSVNELTLKTLSGTDVTIGDSRGPTLVNFWSTSCVICVKEMPHLADFYETHNPDGFQIIAVAMPYDPPNEVLELAKLLQLPFPVALDIKGEASAAFGSIKGTPTSFLLDADGKLVSRYIGALDLDKLEKQVAQLLGTG